MNRIALCLVLAPLMCCANVTLAGSLSLLPVKDNTLYESSVGDLSNGSGEFMHVGATQLGSIRRGLLAFDIAAAVPVGATITSAELTLNLSKVPRTVANPHAFTLHRAITDWGESTSDAGNPGGSGTTAAAGDATWIHAFFSGSNWTAPGGDFLSTASATQQVGTIAPNPVTWGSTVEMVTDVQQWLDNPSQNFGWFILGEESLNGSARRFDTRENSNPANRPVLSIEFTVIPEPATLLLALLGAISLGWVSPRRYAN